MKILIVGAGAVGLVYGQHFTRGGHHVQYLIKKKYATSFHSGVRLSRLRPFRQPLSKIESVALRYDWQGDYDLVILAISSPALRQLDWPELARQLQNTPILMLQPSSADLSLLEQHFKPQQIAQGLISLIAYQAPLQTPCMDHIEYYLPPISMPISADIELRDRIIQLFKQSGIAATPSPSAVAASKLPAAFLMTFLAALEQAHWQFNTLRQRPHLLKQLAWAQWQLLPQLQPLTWWQKIVLKGILTPTCYRLLLRLAPYSVPLPLERYLQYHFIKVREQTYLYLTDYQQQYPSQALRDLTATIETAYR